MKVLGVVALVLVAVGVVGLVWRRRGWPCPLWLMPLLENPYVARVLGSALLLRRARVEPGMRVLDVGCGAGRVALPAAARVGASGAVVALDLQPAMLARLEARARARGVTNVETVCAGIGAAPLPPASFDRAFLVTVLGEVHDRPAALRAIHAALEPGGLLSVSELIPDPHYQRRRTVRRLAEEAGFQFEEGFGSWLAFTLNFTRRSPPAA